MLKLFLPIWGARRMDDQEKELLLDRLQELRVEHRDLDEIIDRLSEDPLVDQLQIQRLKKRKLHLKDMIRKLESTLIPDIEA
jgi:hypothetical protein